MQEAYLCLFNIITSYRMEHEQSQMKPCPSFIAISSHDDEHIISSFHYLAPVRTFKFSLNVQILFLFSSSYHFVLFLVKLILRCYAKSRYQSISYNCHRDF